MAEDGDPREETATPRFFPPNFILRQIDSAPEPRPGEIRMRDHGNLEWPLFEFHDVHWRGLAGIRVVTLTPLGGLIVAKLILRFGSGSMRLHLIDGHMLAQVWRYGGQWLTLPGVHVSPTWDNAMINPTLSLEIHLHATPDMTGPRPPRHSFRPPTSPEGTKNV